LLPPGALRGPIDVRDGDGAEGGRVDKPQVHGFGEGREQGQPASQGHGMDQKPVLVDKAGLDGTLGEPRAAMSQDILAGLLLQTGDLFDEIARQPRFA